MKSTFFALKRYSAELIADRPYSYRNTVKFWLTIIIFVAGSDGVVFWKYPDLVENSAYELAFRIMPVWAWALVMLATASLAGAGLVMEGKRIGSLAVTWSFVMHAATCAVFGLSILALTLDGTLSALTGASKWWVFFVVPVKILSSGAAIEGDD